MSFAFLIWLEHVFLCYFVARFISIMTGEDSSSTDNKSLDYGRSTPPPTTSYGSRKQDFGDVKSAAEPDKDKDKEKNKEDKDDDKEEIDLLRPDANPGYKPEEKREENKISSDDKDYSGRDKEEKECKKLDGSDKLDGQWIPAKDTKPDADQDDDDRDDSCTVKCLYYTMQCCECTIS